MSHAKRYANKGVANEGWGPKTGNRAATGSQSAVLWCRTKNSLAISYVSEISGMNKFCNAARPEVTPYVKDGRDARDDTLLKTSLVTSLNCSQMTPLSTIWTGCAPDWR